MIEILLLILAILGIIAFFIAFMACMVDGEALGAIVCVLLLIGCIVGTAVAANTVSRTMSAEDCHNWSVSTGLPTKFASYTYWDYGCLVKTSHGNWVPTSNYNAYQKGR
jgi:hypothetical protein